MPLRYAAAALVLPAIAAASVATYARAATAASTVASSAPSSAIAFEPNEGQAPAAARFVAHTPGGIVALTGSGAELVLSSGGTPPGGRAPSKTVPPPPTRVVIAEQYVGLDTPLQLTPSEPLHAHVSYMTGAAPSAWLHDVPTYGAVSTQLAPGIDLTWSSARGWLETIYTVAAGADAGRIRWVEAGAAGVSVDPSGNLRLALPAVRAGGTTAAPVISERAPRAWQPTPSGARAVPVGFRIDAGGVIGFSVGPHDANLPLVIDPTVEYASYLGGDDVPYGLAVDGAGDVVVTGHTGSTSFPVTPGAYQSGSAGSWDVYVTTMDPRTGALLWSTYIGSSGNDGAFGLALDPRGAVVVTGFAGASDFPTTAGAYQTSVIKAGTGVDAFVLRLSPDGGTLEASTLLGGHVAFPNNDNIRVTVPDDEDLGTDVVVGAGDVMTISGETSSVDFPTTVGAYQPIDRGGTADAFVARVSADATTLVASTYLGGLDYDFASGLALDPAGDVYVDGETTSTDFPTTSGALQTANGGGFSCFIARLSGDLTTLRWSTYYGGSTGSNNFQYTVPGNLLLDPAGNLLFGGETNAVDLPVTAATFQRTLGGQDDAYVAAISPDGTALRYATYLGGDSYDGAFDLALDNLGNIWVAGYTTSRDFPATPDAPQRTFTDGYQGGFLSELTPGAAGLVFSTHIGGSTSHDTAHEPAWDSAYVVAAGPAEVATAGITSTTDFPVTANAVQPAYGGGYLADWVMVLQAGQPPAGVPDLPLPVLSLAAAATLLAFRIVRRARQAVHSTA